jgi:hypothetical protein
MLAKKMSFYNKTDYQKQEDERKTDKEYNTVANKVTFPNYMCNSVHIF